MSLEFRILSGSNLGAAFRLQDGVYTVGTTPECAIMLHESPDLKGVLELAIAGDEVKATPLEGRWFLDEAPLTGPAALKPGAVLRFALTSFAYQVQGEILESLNSFARPAEDKEEQGESPAQETAVPEPAAAAQEQEQTAQSAPRPSYKLKAVLASLVLLCLLFFLIFGNALDKRQNAQESLETVQNYLQQYPYDLKAVYRQGLIEVTGRVQTNAQIDEIAASMPQVGYPVEIKLLSLQSLLENLTHAFKRFGITVRAADEQPGIGLYGYIINPVRENDIVNALHEEFYNRQASFNFVYQEELAQFLYEGCTRHDLDLDFAFTDGSIIYNGAMTPAQYRSLLTLKAEAEEYCRAPLDFRDLRTLNLSPIDILDRSVTAVTAGRDLYGRGASGSLFAQTGAGQEGAAAQEAVQNGPWAQAGSATGAGAGADLGSGSGSGAAAGPFSAANVMNGALQGLAGPNAQPSVRDQFRLEDIAGVTLEPLRFISLKDGRKFFEGARLPGGYELTSIGLNRLILYKNGQEVIYELK